MSPVRYLIRPTLAPANSSMSSSCVAVTPDETEYQLRSIPAGGSRTAHLGGVVVRSTCVRCHFANGIFSVNTYGRSQNGQPGADSVNSNPQLLPATAIGCQGTATADWKMRQLNWGLLRARLRLKRPAFNNLCNCVHIVSA